MAVPCSSQNSFGSTFEAFGFDVHGATTLSEYNKQVKDAFRIIEPKSPKNTLFVLGNSKQLWQRFAAHLNQEPAWIDKKDPFDDFVEFQVSQISKILNELKIQHSVFFAHQTTPHIVAIQQAAQLAGMAWIAPSHLSIHQTYGPWFSLRCLILTETTTPPTSKVGFRSCKECKHACEPQFKIATSKQSGDWKAWLALRDSCPKGKEHRFDSKQIEYHYTKNKHILKTLLKSA